MATNVLCTACDNIFDDVFLSLCQSDRSLGIPVESAARNGIKFLSLAEWESSALSSTCHLCAMFYHASNVERCERVVSSKLLIESHTNDVWGLEAVNVTLWPSERSSKMPANLIDESSRFMESPMIFILQYPKGTTSRRQAACPVTWSPATVELVKSWLSECTNSHPNCNQQPGRHRLPLRLIDVDPGGCISALQQNYEDLAPFSLEAVPEILLCSTAGLPETTEYLTLSHRWDPCPSMLLSNATLSLFSMMLPASLLNKPGSKTFREAIMVTRSLGFRYLWIDSICINQDDEAEKDSEIAFMGEIYSNSSANISATGAAGGADGLFFERNPLVMDPCHKKFATPNGSEPFVNVVASITGRWDKHVFHAPLNTRGWVYQERMLAPRLIHFARDQIYWDCCTIESSEASTRGAIDRSLMYNKPSKSRMKEISNDWYREWARTTEIYSNFFLTFPRDRLPAISAIARYFCTKRGLQADDYLAGCWRPDLPHCLYWSRYKYRPKCENYVAPSWSWASLGGPFFYDTKEDFTSLVDIIDVSIAPKRGRRGDCFGEIASGHIRLHCSLTEFIWQPETQELNITISDHRTLQLQSDKHVDLNWDFYILKMGSFQADEFWLPLPDGRLFFSDNVFYLIPLGITTGEFSDGSQRVIGLILHRTFRKGQYVRVGTFNFWIPIEEEEQTNYDMHFHGSDAEARQVTPEEISKALLGELQVLDAESSLQEIVDGKYLVEII